MKRVNGTVTFEWQHRDWRLHDEDGLEINTLAGWWPPTDDDIGDLTRTEDGRALLAEAIQTLDHPYADVHVTVPPHMRAPGSKGSTNT